MAKKKKKHFSIIGLFFKIIFVIVLVVLYSYYVEPKMISYKEYEIKDHPSVKGVKIIEGQNNFPISWLNQQGYCEYQLYLENMKGIETQPTPAMT